MDTYQVIYAYKKGPMIVNGALEFRCYFRDWVEQYALSKIVETHDVSPKDVLMAEATRMPRGL